LGAAYFVWGPPSSYFNEIGVDLTTPQAITRRRAARGGFTFTIHVEILFDGSNSPGEIAAVQASDAGGMICDRSIRIDREAL